MASQRWQNTRRDWYASWVTRTGQPPVCLVCGTAWTLRTGHLHHATYARLGHEHPTDLIPLCRADHVRLHDLYDASPAWRRLSRASATAGMIAALRRQHHAGAAAQPSGPSCSQAPGQARSQTPGQVVS